MRMSCFKLSPGWRVALDAMLQTTKQLLHSSHVPPCNIPRFFLDALASLETTQVGESVSESVSEPQFRQSHNAAYSVVQLVSQSVSPGNP